MANQLDELNPEVREEGLETNVIVKKIPAEVGFGSTLFQIILWVLGIFPGVIFLFMKITLLHTKSSLNRHFFYNLPYYFHPIF